MSSQSVTGKKWVLKDFNIEELNFIKDNFYLDEIVAKLLAIRKIKREEIKNYLEPTIRNILPNPNTIEDLEKASKRLIYAIKNKQKIGIFGDYDVDGACSTALLANFFSLINIEYEIHIPDRQKEGYGPSESGFKKLIDRKVDLIITVDCGTLSFKPIEFANNKNKDVIIIDHHQSEVKLPEAHSIVNPNRYDDKSNLKHLCASGVCFMFLIKVCSLLRKENWFKNNNFKEPNLIDFLDLVSLGTICDVVPLVGLNRAIVKQGLKIIRQKKNLGLKTLIDICNISGDPTTYHVGYILGPRINAGGRVGKCDYAANLLLNINPKNAFKIATELNRYNKERQLIESELLIKILKEIKDLNDPVIILYGKEWHEGVIGIIASKIKERYNKPTIIISLKDGIGKASARSVVGFDIGALIVSAVQNGLLIKGGGHKMAGGFSVHENNIQKIKEFIFKKFNKQNNKISTEKKVLIDSVISPSAVNLEFYNKINSLSPFGSGNSEPKFTIENLKLLNSKIVGEKHIKSNLIGSDGSCIKSISFNSVDSNISAYLLKKGNKTFNIAGKLSLNEWKGKKNVEFIIDDISVNKTHENTVPSSIG